MISPSKYLLDTSREYAIYVCDTRGIPSVIDGLKTSQRIALWLLRNKADKVKTVGLAGQMAAEKLYVHGDASANGAINLLAAPFKNNTPLIEGLGEFGSRIKPDGIGAPRYTEVRRSKAAEAFLYSDLPNVPLTKNYDGSNMQPCHFLPLIPNVLLNGVIGVAVGFSTNILPHALKDIVQATLDVAQGKKPKLMLPSWSAYNVDVKAIGPNQYEVSGRVEIVNTSTIKITELPPGLDLDDFRKRLIKMEDEDLIADFDDNSAEAINIEVRVKRGMLKGWTPQKCIDFLKLKEKMTERIVVLDWNLKSIRTYDNPLDLVHDFVQFRLGVYVQRYQRLLDEANYDLLYWKLLRALFKDGFMKRLGTFADKTAMVADVAGVALKAKIRVDESQRERAITLPTYRWTVDFKTEIEKKIAELEGSIKEYRLNLDKPERIKAIYISELEDLKKLK